jgi:hypothetical protein
VEGDAAEQRRGAILQRRGVFDGDGRPGGDAGMLLEAIARQTGGQWKGFRDAHRGGTQLAGRAGQYVTYQGTNPAGADAYLEMMAVSEQGSTYLIMISAPAAEFGRFQGAFDQMEKSFTLTARKQAAAPAAPPVPAGATAKAAAPATAGKPAAGNAGYYRMKKVAIVDEHGFERPMTAMSLLVPADWQFQGSVQYARVLGCHANMVQVSFRATSPDGTLGLELFPGNTWQWADDAGAVQLMRTSNQQMAQFGRKGCDIMPPLGAAEYLRQAVLPAVRRQARVAAMEPMPEIAHEVEQRVQEAQAAAARQGLQVRARGDVGRARLAYDVNGQVMEEWVTAVTYASGMPGRRTT